MHFTTFPSYRSNGKRTGNRGSQDCRLLRSAVDKGKDYFYEALRDAAERLMQSLSTTSSCRVTLMTRLPPCSCQVLYYNRPAEIDLAEKFCASAKSPHIDPLSRVIEFRHSRRLSIGGYAKTRRRCRRSLERQLDYQAKNSASFSESET